MSALAIDATVVSQATLVSRAALVIPLWKGKSGVEPLDDRNPWREAWQALNTAGSAVPVAPPLPLTVTVPLPVALTVD